MSSRRLAALGTGVRPAMKAANLALNSPRRAAACFRQLLRGSQRRRERGPPQSQPQWRRQRRTQRRRMTKMEGGISCRTMTFEANCAA